MLYGKSNWEMKSQINKRKIFDISRVKSIISPKTIENVYTNMLADGLQRTHNSDVAGYISVDPYKPVPEFEINLPLDIEEGLTRNVSDIQKWLDKNIPGVVLKVNSVQNDDDNTLLARGTMEVETKALVKALRKYSSRR